MTLLPLVRAAGRRLKNIRVERQVRYDSRASCRAFAPAPGHRNRLVERGGIDRRDDYFLLRSRKARRYRRSAAGAWAASERRASAATARERDLQMPMLMRESSCALLRAGQGDSGDAATSSRESASAPGRSKPRSS